MYQIGAFSRMTNLPIKTLHYYDEIGLLSPNTRLDNGYRLYDEHDYQKAILIRELKEFQFSIAELKEIFKSFDNDDIPYYLNEKAKAIKKEINESSQRLYKLENAIANWHKTDLVYNYEMNIEILPKLKIASIIHDSSINHFKDSIQSLSDKIKDVIDGPMLSIYPRFEYNETSIIEVAAPVKHRFFSNQIKFQELKECEVLSTIHRGDYLQLSHAYKALFDYAKANHLELIAPVYELYLKGPGTYFYGNPNHFETQIMIPIKKKGD